MKIEFNPTDVFSFEKVITPSLIKLVFYTGFGVKVFDAIVSLVHYHGNGYAFISFVTGIISSGITLLLACQLLLALQQKCAPKPAPEPPAKTEPPSQP
jgi:hypothetical protein